MSDSEDRFESYVEHGFEVQLPQPRPQYQYGNSILYSLGNSFTEGYMWRIAVNPSDDCCLRGYLCKVPVTDDPSHSHRRGVETVWNEAERALRSAFTNVRDVSKLETVPKVNIEWTDVMRTHVAFTLRGRGIEKTANQDEEIEINGGAAQVLTSDIRQNVLLRCVYGLVGAVQNIRLHEVAFALGMKYGREDVRYLIHCTDPDRYELALDLGMCNDVADDNSDDVDDDNSDNIDDDNSDDIDDDADD